MAGLWAFALIGLMSLGVLSSARIGAMTWGNQHDIWSSAIAISQINFGISGKLALKEVEQAIADEVTSTKNVWSVGDQATLAITQDPAAITRGFQKAASLTPDQVRIPANRDDLVGDWCEDLGYADFYNLAFRMFGFNAYSTHILYMGILALSVLLFQLTFFRDRIATATGLLAVTALFLLSASSFFSNDTPSFAANRFLSTLGFVPFLHLIFAALRAHPVTRLEIGGVLLQSMLLAFSLSLRSSAAWLVIAFAIFLIFLIGRRILRHDCRIPSTRELVANLARGPGKRPAMIAILAFGVLAAASLVRYAQTDERYFRDDNLPHHLVWHNAFLGLGLSPEWPSVKPYPDLPDFGDGAGFLLFAHRMEERGESANSLSNEVYAKAYYRARTYERVIRDEYLAFAAAHPRYMLKLFFEIKPRVAKEILTGLINSVPVAAIVLALVSVFLGAALLASARYAKFGVVLGLIWLSSLLPVFWAYPATYVMSDADWATLLILVAIPALVVAWLVQVVAAAKRSITHWTSPARAAS